MNQYLKIEEQRQFIQRELDTKKTKAQRNALGQFSTPIALATDILQHAKKLLKPNENIRFLDPAVGTGSFVSALYSCFPSTLIEVAVGYEIDEHYAEPSRNLWMNNLLEYHVSDFTTAIPPANEDQKFNLMICNPPYVRHHHMTASQKQFLQAQALSSANVRLSGLAGLYCYFLALSHSWLKSGGIAGWLIPSEFMDVNYGQAVRSYFLREVKLLQIHRFDPKDVQFDDALVSSAIVWFQKAKPDDGHVVTFTYGGTLDEPHKSKDVGARTLLNEKKWSRFPLNGERAETSLPRIGDFFHVKRGIATGDNSFFILSKKNIEEFDLPLSQFKPVLPSPRYLSESEIFADVSGHPHNYDLYVLDSELPIKEIEITYPTLYRYIEKGVINGVASRHLCASRKLWYSQEKRLSSLFYCTYIGRTDKAGRKPFRFILNHSQAIVTNSYLILYPKEELKIILLRFPQIIKIIFDLLNRTTDKAMIDEGRVYGGGMHKLEPKELANVPAIELKALIENYKKHILLESA